ncbi:MAG: exo-beta-N-acetylmuramidase NamZ family protein [Armatimonadota bacterium]
MRIRHLVIVVTLCAVLAPPLSPTSGAALPAVRPGIDSVLGTPGILRGKRIGLVTHLAGVTAEGLASAAALAQAPKIRLNALFAPEHGIDGTYDAGAAVPTISSRTPVYSLYGSTFSPTRQMLARVDVLVVDLQDVGVRPFTYATTMALVMASGRESGKPIVILDRPNPLGGLTVDGPVLEPQYRSLIGAYPIPYVHGMTIGELARLYNRDFGIGAQLTVIPMNGWTRQMRWADTGLAWVNPSPGVTGPDVAFTYAATGPTEGTNLWNGVATESRFQVVLASWIDDAAPLVEALNRHGLPGVIFASSAIPHPHTGAIWRGVRLNVTDAARFLPSATFIHILAEIRRLHGDGLEFKRPRRGPYPFDLVWGTSAVRLAIERGDSPAAIVARWQPGLARFKKLREPHLLYK